MKKPKFKNKYKTDSMRLKNWDYSSNAAYFITICTKDRENYFGKIENNKMKLSKIGEIAKRCWIEIPNHFPFVKLETFVIMPNHVHGIIRINKSVETVETQNLVSPQDSNWQKNIFGPQSKNLASIIRGYKIGVTKNARKIYQKISWQSLYYDHIVRNNESLNRIRNYIRKNPQNWKKKK